MKKLLFIDACVRKDNSRTLKIANSFLDNLGNKYEVKHLDLAKMDLKPLINERYAQRDVLLNQHNLNDSFFDLAHEFEDADLIVMAAPFWDLSFPAIIKIYVENVSVDGITFTSTPEGLKGLCKASDLIYFTSRGGIYHEAENEQATPYLRHLCDFFGIDKFTYIDADGMDIVGYDSSESLNKAIDKAKELAKNY